MKQDKVFWWVSASSLHWRFRSFYLALVVPLPRNIESQARIFRTKVSGTEMNFFKKRFSLGLKI